MIKSLLRRIFLFIILMFLVDFLFGKCMDFINTHTEKGDYGRNNYICNEADQEILIFGSSRAIHHYNPDIFKNKLALSCYNCGEDGMGIILSYGRYKLAQRKSQPKIIIYDIEPSFDLLKNDNSKYLGFLRPFYDVPGIDSIFFRVNPNEQYKMLSNLYRYNSRWIDILAQYCSKSTLLAKDYTYSPLKKTLDYEPEKYVFSQESDCDSLKLYYLERFIKDCKANGTKLVFAISPVYGESRNRLLQPFVNICESFQIPLFDHFGDEIFTKNRDAFKDKQHLNSSGAEHYSEIIADEILTLYKPYTPNT